MCVERFPLDCGAVEGAGEEGIGVDCGGIEGAGVEACVGEEGVRVKGVRVECEGEPDLILGSGAGGAA